jgi:phosphatidylglycerol:prolipoprotein diacylglycerol transferase
VKPLLHFGPFTIPTYGLLLGFAIIMGTAVGIARSRRFGVPPQRFAELSLYAVFGALLGAKMVVFIVKYDFSRGFVPQLLALSRAGGAFLGGLLSALLIFIWYTRRNNLPTWSVGDAAAPGVALAQSIGRMGCFMAGCCYGRPTDVPWAIAFTNPLSKLMAKTPLWTPLHPTQIYEAGATLLIAVLLLATEKLGRYFPGRTFWTYMMLYAIARLIIEQFRGDPRGTVFGLISTAQAMALVLIPMSAAMLLSLRRESEPRAANTSQV